MHQGVYRSWILYPPRALGHSYLPSYLIARDQIQHGIYISINPRSKNLGTICFAYVLAGRTCHLLCLFLCILSMCKCRRNTRQLNIKHSCFIQFVRAFIQNGFRLYLWVIRRRLHCDKIQENEMHSYTCTNICKKSSAHPRSLSTSFIEKKIKLLIGPRKAKQCLRTRVKWQIQINLRMQKVSSGSLLSIHTFCSIQWFCLRTLRDPIRLRGCAGWSWPSKHYENMPIQIYWKFYHQKMKKKSDKFLIFFMFLLKT